jgi:hypothetical protein
MQGEPAGPPPSPDDAERMVTLLQLQVTRLRRWFEWQRWLLEPRSFAPPEDDSAEDEGPEDWSD